LHNKSRIGSWVQLCGDLDCLLLLYEAISIVVNEIEYPLKQFEGLVALSQHSLIV